ncbi:MAG: TonB-dependent receptor plug domain-containing protein [Crocinitomicaceae bacterium]|nr:TonB-dependent receptor plug domain-containing protein [Crocinitomicaceae bacterium]
MIRYLSATCLFLCLNGTLTAQITTETEPKEKEDSLSPNEAVFITSLDELDNNGGDQNTSGLLQSSRDVFASAAGFNFSAARFRIRGYNSDQTAILINGVPMNDPESGWGEWFMWGGLNDVTRYSETKNWLTSNQYHFGGIGGYSNINMRATNIRAGHRLSYAMTNRAYRHRLMYTYGTGMQSNGWAFAISVSARYAQEGYIDGTFYEAFSYYLAAEKKINDNQSLSFSVIGAPTRQGRQNISIQEAYDLSGDIYYNSNWGYQTLADGTRIKRNSRVQTTHMPIAILTHDWKISSNAKLTTSGYVTFGKSGQTALNWNDDKDPRPDYYKYLPSYYENIGDSVNADVMYSNWQSEASRQVDWDQLYFANSKNIHTVKDVNGVAGNDLEGLRAKYIVENLWNNQISGGFGSTYNRKMNKLNLSMGVYAQMQQNHYFKTVEDLLGADYWLDVDQFAEQAFVDPNAAQNDLQTPNRVVYKGDIFGYNYNIVNIKSELFAQAEYSTEKFDFYGALELSNKMFWREGLYQTGRFPDNSLGKSETHNFFNYAVKGGAVYKLSGRQFITVNAAYLTQAPSSRNAYLSPRTRDFVAGNLKNETIYTGDVNYIVRYPKLRMRLTYYYTERKDAILLRSFYHDDYNALVNYMMEGVDYLDHGIEFGIDANVIGGFSVNAVAAYGQHLYNSRPTATISVDNSAEVLATDRVIYLTNYKIGGMPQSAYSLGVKYTGKKYWFAGANFNYYADIYLDPNPDRRTEEAIAGYVDTDPQVNEVLDQTKLDNGYSVSMFAGKSFKISNYFLNVNVNISNLTNNQSFVTGGFEQLRYDTQNIGKFPPKLGYMYGLNYFVMATLRF